MNRMLLKEWLVRRSGWVVLALLVVAVFPAIAYQQDSIVGCSGLECDLEDLLDIPVKIYDFMLGLAGAVLLLVIIWSGIRMMLYYSSDMPEGELQAAKNTLRNGLTGFVIVVAAYLIVHVLLFQVLGLKSGSDVGQQLEKQGIE